MLCPYCPGVPDQYIRLSAHLFIRLSDCKVRAQIGSIR
jgi:hypothetical protein